MVTKHLSLRLPAEASKKLDWVSRRHGMTKSALAKAFIEEGLRMDAHPGIIFKPGPTGRRAAVMYGPDVWEIIGSFTDRWDPSADEVQYLSESIELPEHSIRVAIEYYRAYQQEIDERIRRNEEAAETGYAEWLARQPGARH